jgi:hypothetical protein
MTRKRKWPLRAAGVAVMLVAGVGTWAGINATELRAKFTARQLSAATTDDERAKWADTLLGYGNPGTLELIECIQTGDDPTRRAAVAAFDKHLNTMPDGDSRAVTVSGVILDAFPSANDAGKQAILQLIPTILKRTGSTHTRRCRTIVAEALKMTDFEARLAAVRLAIHPEIKLRAELMPLLSAPEPQMRGAALFAVAIGGDCEPAISDEELFRWLHDSDASVRKICRDALVSRDRSDIEISLGRRLTHPDASERLKLLLDLRYDDDVPDPEPWLERLSHDPEPAVRAGAARVAVEVAIARSQPFPAWVARVADADPHPTVRFIVAYYRALPPSVRDPLRPAGGP